MDTISITIKINTMLFKPNKTKLNQKTYNKQFNTILKNHFNNINHSTSYNLNNTELNDLLNLITYITLTNK